MSLQIVVLLVLKLSIVLTIFSIALDARADETLFLLRRPAKLLRSLAAMSLVMPLVVLAIVAVFPLQPVVKVALVALSVSPVPPILPNRVLKMGGSEAYTIGLLAVAALLCIVIAPVVVSLFGVVLGIEAHTDVVKIALAVTVSVLAPLAAGVLVRRFWPHIADRRGPADRPAGRGSCWP
ncbi:MAG: hypothetical protein WDM81_02380 [Rhizomicrobium sp.]